MKIINRTTFLSLPAGILFSKYEHCVFGELSIKGDSIGNPPIDFGVQPIADAVETGNELGDFSDILFNAAENGTSFSMDFDCQGRDGYFDQNQLFAVWEEADLTSLIERLKRCVPAQNGEKQS